MKLFFSIILLYSFFLFSCSTSQETQDRKCAKTQQKYELKAFKLGCLWQIHDSMNSTITQTVIRDTIIYFPIPGEMIHDSIKIPIEIPFNTPINILETTHSISRAWIENSILKHTLIQKESNISAIIPGALHNTYSIKKRIIKVPYFVEKPVRLPLRIYEVIFFYSGLVFWILLVSWLVYKFRFRLLYIFKK